MESPLVGQKGGAWQLPGGRVLRFVPQPEEIGEDSPQAGHPKQAPRAAKPGGARKTRERTGAADIGFETFWVAYPRRVKRKDAQRAWAKLAPNEALKQRILSDIAQKAATQDWHREGGRYIPYPASYLNGARWEDEPARPTSMFDDFLAFEMQTPN